MINARKTTQEILQEEVLRERVGTLVRTAERLAEALERLREMEREIAALMEGGQGRGVPAGAGAEAGRGRQRFLREFNRKIQAYNRQREHARTRYHYLIVTREALGIIHHERLEEFYPIPPKGECLPEEWDSQTEDWRKTG
ncbi:MAG: hypothetical protein LLG97_11005 [Deltaproteobacteria bacterium]|nr:hypothetical protein [Deltaproteobacteria bacterium]